MGSCLSLLPCFDKSSTIPESTDRNSPLKRNIHKQNVKVDFKTIEELEKERATFWHTAPAYDGRKEIWQALKATVSAIQEENYDHAQVLLDSVGITLPTGSLDLCYDELGTAC